MSEQDTYQPWFHSALPAAPTSMHPFWRKVHGDEALTSKLSRIPSQPRGVEQASSAGIPAKGWSLLNILSTKNLGL